MTAAVLKYGQSRRLSCVTLRDEDSTDTFYYKSGPFRYNGIVLLSHICYSVKKRGDENDKIRNL